MLATSVLDHFSALADLRQWVDPPRRQGSRATASPIQGMPLAVRALRPPSRIIRANI